jgi:hypothetical protein
VSQGDEFGGLAFTGAAVGAWDAPAEGLAESYPRRLATAESPNLTSGTLTVTACGLPNNTEVSAITMFTGHVGGSGPSHGWYCLMDRNAVILAISADQLTAAWPAQTAITLPMIKPVTTTAGLFYMGVSVTATLAPNFASTAAQITSGIAALAPLLSGVSSAGLTGPPAAGTQMAAITAPTAYPLYGIIS